MTEAQFQRLLAASPLRGKNTIEACRLVLVEHISEAAAARAVQINQSAVSRALAKIPKRICPTCRKPY
jgi:predicted DNA-binding protein (UPF0251 family)